LVVMGNSSSQTASKPVAYSYDFFVEEEEAERDVADGSGHTASGAIAAAAALTDADLNPDKLQQQERHRQLAQQAKAMLLQGDSCGDRVDAAFGFDRIDSSSLVTSCFISSSALLTIRVFMLVYVLTVLGWHWYALRSPVTMALSLTSWTQLLTASYFVFAVVMSSKQVGGCFESGTISDSVASRLTFLMFEIAYTWSLITVVWYWLTQFPLAAHMSTVELLSAVHLHGATLAFVVVDLILARIKLELVHYVISSMLAIVYCTVHAVYISPLTSVLATFKWNSFMTVLIVFGVIFGILLSFVVTVLVTTARDRCTATDPIRFPSAIGGGDTESMTNGVGKPRHDGEHAFSGFAI